MIGSDDRYLDAELSRHYADTSDERPPAELDAKILKAAREAAQPKATQKTSLLNFGRWLAPVATAASVLLVIGLVRLLPPDPVQLAPVGQETADRPQQDSGEDAVLKEAVTTTGPERMRAVEEVREETTYGSNSEQNPGPASTQQSGFSDPVPPATGVAERKQKPVAADSVIRLESAAKREFIADEDKTPVAPDTDFRPNTPVKWVAYINGLIDRRETVRAAQALAEFAELYPEHPQVGKLRARLRNL